MLLDISVYPVTKQPGSKAISDKEQQSPVNVNQVSILIQRAEFVSHVLVVQLLLIVSDAEIKLNVPAAKEATNGQKEHVDFAPN